MCLNLDLWFDDSILALTVGIGVRNWDLLSVMMVDSVDEEIFVVC